MVEGTAWVELVCRLVWGRGLCKIAGEVVIEKLTAWLVDEGLGQLIELI
jgi:hypothetical protein